MHVYIYIFIIYLFGFVYNMFSRVLCVLFPGVLECRILYICLMVLTKIAIVFSIKVFVVFFFFFMYQHTGYFTPIYVLKL